MRDEDIAEECYYDDERYDCGCCTCCGCDCWLDEEDEYE